MTSHFFAVANSMLMAMHWQSPELLTEKLSRASKTHDAPYEARTAQETELGAGKSRRSSACAPQRGLAGLQGVLEWRARPTSPRRAPTSRRSAGIARLKEEMRRAIVARSGASAKSRTRRKARRKGRRRTKAKNKPRPKSARPDVRRGVEPRRATALVLVSTRPRNVLVLVSYSYFVRVRVLCACT